VAAVSISVSTVSGRLHCQTVRPSVKPSLRASGVLE